MPTQDEKPFGQTLADLGNEKYPPAKDDLRALTDLEGEKLEAFRALWQKLSASRRLLIMTNLGEIAEEDLTIHPGPAARLALTDANASVRATAVQILWGNEEPDLMVPFLKLLTTDPSPEVREAAATALGTFVYLKELEEVEAAFVHPVEDALLRVFNGDDVIEVRRRALESVGYSSRPKAAEAIHTGYRSPEEAMKISAVCAMGRSLDNQWNATILHELRHVNPLMRFEAVRAAGELQLREAIPLLIESVRDVDPEVQDMTIWALGEIGGEEARAELHKLLKKAKGARRELIDDALATAEIMDDLSDFDLFNAEDWDEAAKRRLN